MRLRLTILIVLVLFFAAMAGLYVSGYLGGGGAASETGGEPLDAEQFVEAYVELAQLAETMPIGTPEYNKERERVLGMIGITPTQVEETLAYYNEHPDLWRPIWETIQVRLTDELEETTKPQELDTTAVETP